MANSKMISIQDLLDKLDKQKKGDSVEDFNPFCMMNMAKSEKRHSYFLKNLLDPKYPHTLGNGFFKEFCKEVWQYTNTNSAQGVLSNDNIIKDLDNIIKGMNTNVNSNIKINKNINSFNDIINLFPDYTPRTEEKTGQDGKNNGFVDIIIECKSTSSVLVIENKIDSTTHSNQLVKYMNHYAKYSNQFYVYLTKFGDIPINHGDGGDEKYNAGWCIFDYNSIATIVNNLCKSVKDNYIKKTLRSYSEMTKKLVLKDGDKWEITRDYAEQIEELYNCLKNKNDNLEYCKNRIKALLLNNNSTLVIKDNPLSMDFVTASMLKHYSINGVYPQTGKYVWRCGADKGGLKIMLVEPNGSNKSTNATLLLTNTEWIEPRTNKLDCQIQHAIDLINKKKLPY